MAHQQFVSLLAALLLTQITHGQVPCNTGSGSPSPSFKVLPTTAPSLLNTMPASGGGGNNYFSSSTSANAFSAATSPPASFPAAPCGNGASVTQNQLPPAPSGGVPTLSGIVVDTPTIRQTGPAVTLQTPPPAVSYNGQPQSSSQSYVMTIPRKESPTTLYGPPTPVYSSASPNFNAPVSPPSCGSSSMGNRVSTNSPPNQSPSLPFYPLSPLSSLRDPFPSSSGSTTGFCSHNSPSVAQSQASNNPSVFTLNNNPPNAVYNNGPIQRPFSNNYQNINNSPYPITAPAIQTNNLPIANPSQWSPLSAPSYAQPAPMALGPLPSLPPPQPLVYPQPNPIVTPCLTAPSAVFYPTPAVSYGQPGMLYSLASPTSSVPTFPSFSSPPVASALASAGVSSNLPPSSFPSLTKPLIPNLPPNVSPIVQTTSISPSSSSSLSAVTINDGSKSTTTVSSGGSSAVFTSSNGVKSDFPQKNSPLTYTLLSSSPKDAGSSSSSFNFDKDCSVPIMPQLA